MEKLLRENVNLGGKHVLEHGVGEKKNLSDRRQRIKEYSDLELFEKYSYSEEYNWCYEDLEDEIVARWLANMKRILGDKSVT